MSSDRSDALKTSFNEVIAELMRTNSHLKFFDISFE